MQTVLNVPVIDAVLAPFKLAELLVETAEKFGWYPSRKGGSESPPLEELDTCELLKGDPAIGNFLRDEEGR